MSYTLFDIPTQNVLHPIPHTNTMSFTTFHTHKCPSPPSTHIHTHTQNSLPHKTLNIIFQTKLQQLLPEKMDKVTDQVPGQVGAGTPAGGAEAETPGAAFGVIGTQVE